MTEKKKNHHGNKWMPVLYATYYGIFKEIAESHGYALAIHGSFTRDMDLILVPWVDEVSPVEKVLDEWFKKIGYRRPKGTVPWSSTSDKPHGRKAYTLMTGGGGYVDVSVLPTINTKEDVKS